MISLRDPCTLTKGRAPVSLPWLLVQLAASTAIILYAATRLTRAADVIAERTGLGRSFVGVLLLATATSLPEMGTGVSSVRLYHETDIAMGAAFGSNLFNLVILCFLDFSWRRGALLSSVSRTSSLVAWLGIVVIGLCTAAVLVPQRTDLASTWVVSPASLFILGVFFLSMWAIYRSDRRVATLHTTADAQTPAAQEGMTLRQATWRYVVAAVFVIGGSIWLAHTGDGLVQHVGMDASFVGTQFLALCTSLPEVATSFAALRMGATDLAVTNVLGSNLFNMGFVIVLNDAAFTEGSIWSHIAPVHALTGAFAIVMTALVLIGLYRRAPARRIGVFESLGLLVLYVVASIAVYRFG